MLALIIAALRVCVSPDFSLTLFTVLLNASLTDGQAMCVFLFKASKQFSSDQISSGSSRLRSMHLLLMICKECWIISFFGSF